MIGRLGAKLNLALIFAIARARGRLFRWLGIWPLTAVLFAGCAPSLATSAERSAGDGAPAGSSEHCRRLSDTERALRIVSVTAGTLGGTAGLVTIPVEDDDVETGLMIGAASAAVIGVTAEAIRAQYAASFTEDCP